MGLKSLKEFATSVNRTAWNGIPNKNKWNFKESGILALKSIHHMSDTICQQTEFKTAAILQQFEADILHAMGKRHISLFTDASEKIDIQLLIDLWRRYRIYRK